MSTIMGSELAELNHQYIQWRGKKRDRRERVPSPLLERTLSLCQKYSLKEVSQACGLRPQVLSEKLNRTSSSESKTIQKTSFVELSASTLFTASRGYSLRQIEICRQDGHHLIAYPAESEKVDLVELVIGFLEKKCSS